MKLKFLIFVPVFLVFWTSCSPTPNSNVEPISLETIDGDTVNITDAKGKQGMWVPSITNKLKDTAYYRNDTLITK